MPEKINTTALAKAIREHADKQYEEAQSAPDSAEYSNLMDRFELLRVLARMVEGKPLNRAFGAPGDWGYNTPIGAALAGR